ncbi:hypothetical protein AB1Y20_005243 [Prymnesium parvum]|uniref:Nucleotide-diphospho-sugar transferase domain-containing protein n=1 Tax=Prymnesium parvum TaxID=97485 RepID=A0AB34J2T3_PRYPA
MAGGRGPVRQPLSADLDAPGVAPSVVRSRSERGELILFATNRRMRGWTYNFVLQLRSRGYENWIALADGNATCAELHGGWSPMVERHASLPLACVWSSYPPSHPGWANWGAADDLLSIYQLWSTRWWAVVQLLRQGTNVLSLDVDAAFFSDVFERLRSPQLAQQDVVITKNTDASQSLNCGFVYFNLRPAARDEAPLAECGAQTAEPAAPAALWLAEMVWARILLFLQVETRELRRPPRREVLWEQDVWNDVVKSAEVRRHVFPWAAGYGRTSDLWERLGYHAGVLGGALHKEKWVGWREESSRGRFPAAPPPELNGAAFWRRDVRRPLRWIPLCPWRLAARAGRLMVAPTWLASLGADPDTSWGLLAAPPPYAYLHLTNHWHCFPLPCWSKASRLFWLRAVGAWDERLDDLALTPHGAPFGVSSRVLSLPPAASAALLALVPRGLADDRPAARRAFRRLHSLVHNLVSVAALLGRTPALPEVPCAFVQRIQPRHNPNLPRSRFGIAHPAFVVVGATTPTCYMAPAQYRHGPQCNHDRVMHPFDLQRFARSVDPRRNLSIRVREERPGLWPQTAEALLSHLAVLCKRAAVLSYAPILSVEGLLPPGEFLVDVPGRSSDAYLLPREKAQEHEVFAPFAAKLLDAVFSDAHLSLPLDLH